MSKVPLRSFAVLCVLVVSIIPACKSRDTRNPIVPGPAADCASSGAGRANGNGPTICVDGTGTLSVNPPSARVWHVLSTDRATPPIVLWQTRPAGGNLLITMKDDGCVEVPKCNGNGQCSARVKSGIGVGATAGSELKRCAYKVTLGEKELDPDVVVIGCCS
jgi:hypothetical protein